MNLFQKIVASLGVGTLLLSATNPAPAYSKTCGEASWYGPGLYNNQTANGEKLKRGTMTAAHPYWPFGSRVKVRNRKNGRVAYVRINDRGPYYGGRVIDLSVSAALSLGFKSQGVTDVCISLVY